MLANISGTAMLRPSRLALLLSEPDLADVVEAIQRATTAWGGLYFPIVDLERPIDHLANFEALAVDALWPLTDVAEAKELANSFGFRWAGLPGWGPFDHQEDLSTRTLQADQLAFPANTAIHLLEWSEEDPLSALYTAWFGQFGPDDVAQAQRKRMRLKGELRLLQSGRQVDVPSEGLTQIGATTSSIRYTGFGPGVGVVLVDPMSPVDLLEFWNLRASGATVFPWPYGFEQSIIPAFRVWIQQLIAQDLILTMPAADESARFIYVWNSTQQGSASESQLEEILLGYRIDTVVGGFTVLGWQDKHPMTTDFTKYFDLEVESRAVSITIPLPNLDWAPGQRPGPWPGVVAADIHVHAERGLDPERTVVLPRVRRLASLVERARGESGPFQRPQGEGGVYGVQASAETLGVNIARPLDVIAGLFDQPDWRFEQSDEGRFGARLGHLLGGSRTQAATQPAVREILLQAGKRGDAAVPFKALLETGMRHRGDWPGLLDRSARKDYSRNIILWLLSQKLLRAVLPLICPACRSKFVLGPDDLGETIACGFCDYSFPLAFAVGSEGSKSQWRYRVAGHVAEPRLRAALPSLAVASVLTEVFGLAPGSQPQAMGTEVISPDRRAEFDIVTVVDTFEPTVILGEVKSHQEIDAQDVNNLEWAQEALRSRGISCYMLIRLAPLG